MIISFGKVLEYHNQHLMANLESNNIELMKQQFFKGVTKVTYRTNGKTTLAMYVYYDMDRTVYDVHISPVKD